MSKPKRLPKAKKQDQDSSPVVLTIGHSTRPLEDFIGLLQHYSVRTVVDIRTVPRSRHNPQFNRETLPGHLKVEGIEYVHMRGLGGLRHPQSDSPNTGWRNASFRGFADYMGTEDFEKNLEDVIQLSHRQQIALMCAETLPWRCHRSLVADALVIGGIRVEHILSLGHHHPHLLTPFGKVQGTRITYPPDQDSIEHSAKRKTEPAPSRSGGGMKSFRLTSKTRKSGDADNTESNG